MTDTEGEKSTGKWEIDLLAARAAIAPNVAVLRKTLLLADAADFRRCDALVVAVVPFANVFGDLDAGVAVRAVALDLSVFLPGEIVLDAEVQQFKSPLGTFARGDVADLPLAGAHGQGN